MPVVSLRGQNLFRLSARARSLAASIALATGMAGCTTMSQDVHEYYTQMAQNYEEAAEKTKMQIVTLKSKARDQIQAGEIGKAKKIQHEINKVEDWQIKCYKERDRFAKAAEDLERKNKGKLAAGSEKPGDRSIVAPKSSIADPQLP